MNGTVSKLDQLGLGHVRVIQPGSLRQDMPQSDKFQSFPGNIAHLAMGSVRRRFGDL